MNGGQSKVHLMTRPMYEALRMHMGFSDKPIGFECITLAGVLIMPDDCDYIEDIKSAEKRGWAKAMDFIQTAQKRSKKSQGK